MPNLIMTQPRNTSYLLFVSAMVILTLQRRDGEGYMLELAGKVNKN